MRYGRSSRAHIGSILTTGLALGGVVGACGAEGEEAGEPDAGDLMDSTYDSPDDFERSDCPADLENVDPEGIWHLRLSPEGGDDFGSQRPAWIRPQGDVIRINGEGEELEAQVAGRSWETARDVESDVFFRHHFRDDTELQTVRALNACGVDDEGALTGEYADCHFPFHDQAVCDLGLLRAFRVEPLSEEPASGVEELAVFAGPYAGAREEGDAAAFSVRTRDDVAYVLAGGGELWTVDVSEPSEPETLGRLEPESGASFVDLDLVDAGDGEVYAALGSAIADVSDPQDPEVVAEVSAPEGAVVDAVATAADRLYLASGSSGGVTDLSVGVYDVSDPREPVRLGDEDDDGGADLASQPPPPARNRVYDLRVEGERAYLSFGMLGFYVLDVSDPAAIETIDVLEDTPRYSRAGAPLTVGDRDLIAHVDEMVGGKLRILDADEGSNGYLDELGEYELRQEVAPGDVAIAGERAYVAHHQDGLRVVDLSEPESPEEIAHYAAWPGHAEPGAGESFADGTMGVDIDSERELVVLADSYLGLVVLAHE